MVINQSIQNITHTSCVHITTVQEEKLERVLHVRDVAVLGRSIGVNYPFRFIVAKRGRAYRKDRAVSSRYVFDISYSCK